MQDNRFDINLIDPKQVRIFRSSPTDSVVRLTLNDERSWREVRIACAKPFSDPDHFIGLRDGEDKEIGMIVDPIDLDPESRAVVEEELDRRYFTPKIQRVVTVDERMGAITWDVETDRGRRRFVVRNMRDNSFPLGPNRLMMTDSEGNRYEFPNVSGMGPKAHQVLSKVI